MGGAGVGGEGVGFGFGVGFFGGTGVGLGPLQIAWHAVLFAKSPVVPTAA